jgi:hypothetical protein
VRSAGAGGEARALATSGCLDTPAAKRRCTTISLQYSPKGADNPVFCGEAAKNALKVLKKVNAFALEVD